jgi:hypothetical protein
MAAGIQPGELVIAAIKNLFRIFDLIRIPNPHPDTLNDE